MRDSQHTRQRIIDAARDLFHERGFHATGVAEIRERAGVLSGTLYHFFPSKAAVLDAVLDWYSLNLDPIVIDPAKAQTADPLERVFAVLAGYRQFIEITRFDRGCPIGNLALELGDTLPGIRAKVVANFEQWIDRIRGFLDAATDRLPPHIDRRALAQFVLTVMEGGIMQARAQRSLEPFDAGIALLRDYFDRLLAAERTRVKGDA
ncbi:MAG: TetR/AcrR family transcriptional regulator [Phycisphaerae bacterium]